MIKCKDMSELITISIPTYRRPSLLLHALHSSLIQDYRPLEIDIGDDSPNSESEDLVRSVTLPAGISLRYWRNSPSLKQPGNVNKLFAQARGSKLVLLHDDDLLMPGAVSALHHAFSSSPSVIAAYGLQHVIRDNGEISPSDTEKHDRYAHRSRDLTGPRQDPVAAALTLQFPNDGFLVHTSLARATGYLSDEEIGDACDADFGIRLALANRSSHFAFIDRYTSLYRLTSSSIRTGHNNCWKQFDHVLKLADLTPPQMAARDQLLTRTAEQSLVDNAVHHRRRRALEIFRSPFYPKSKLRPKPLYHLALIAWPRLAALRDRLDKPESAASPLPARAESAPLHQVPEPFPKGSQL
jgi:glycosyltransferase involved in cell wall biosynthesis